MLYKFNEICGAEVVNFAVGSATGNATIVTTLAGGVDAARVAGQFGEALSGSGTTATERTYLNTGWAPGTYTGDFSISMWLRNRPGNPSALGFGYLFGADGGNFRCFTGSSAKLFLSGMPGSATSVLNLTTLLNAGWVHAACTVDATSLQAIWYINGVADPAVTLTGAVSMPATNFAIGARNAVGSSWSPLDTDEFLFTSRVLTAGEVAGLAAAPHGGDGRFGTSCNNSVLSGNGQRPALGNTAYGLTVSGPSNALAWILFGFSRCSMLGGTVSLPTSLGAFEPGLTGCTGYTDIDFGLVGPIVVLGTGSLAFPMPSGAGWAGLDFWGQSVMLDLSTTQLRASNGIGISIGL